MAHRLLISTKPRLIFWDGAPHVFYDELSPQACERHPLVETAVEFPSCMWQFFGITWDAEFIYVAEAGRKNHGHIHVFDGQLQYQGRLKIVHRWSFGDIHQIYWWDGKLYIMDTGWDRIAIWDGETTKYVRWIGKDEPHIHINSIWNDGEKFWVVEHRMERYPKRIRIFRPLGFKCLDTIYLERALVAPKSGDCGLHNVYVEDGILYTLAPHGMVQYDLASGKGKVFELGKVWGKGNEYLGGLARTPDHWFVGVAPPSSGHRVARWSCDSGIYILNNDFEIEDVVVFPGAGAVTDIRAVDGDLAHNGIRCPYE